VASFLTHLNLRPLSRMLGWLSRGSHPEMQRCFRQWGAIYSAFARRRFLRNSGGGGDWPALAPSTIEGRRRGNRAGGSTQILRDTGTLYNALTIGAPGNKCQVVGDGVIFGFGGGSGHPGGGTIAGIAKAHETGAGHLPERTIIVQPDRDTVDRMGVQLKQAIERMGRRA